MPNLDSTNDLPLPHLELARKVLPLPTVITLGGVSSFWRTIAQSIPTFISFVTVTNTHLPLWSKNHLPPWWRKSFTSNMISKRGIDFFLYFNNDNVQLSNTMDDIRVTWIRSATIKRRNRAALRRFLECGRLSRLEELNFTPPSIIPKGFRVPKCLSGTLRTLIVNECIPVLKLKCVFPELRKLSFIYARDSFLVSHWQRDWRTLATFAPNLEEFSLLYRDGFMDINALSTTAKNIELDWTTIRSFASLSAGMVKMPVERMR